MPRRRLARARALAMLMIITLALAGCASSISGTGKPGIAANATLPVVGDGGTAFDQLVKNSISDVLDFWQQSYPEVSGGKSFPSLQGKFYSVDGFHVTTAAKENGCIAKQATSVIDNAFYCRLDDSVAWDRDPQHLVPALGSKYGSFLVTMVFAHEFGHVVQQRLGIFDQDRATIFDESQADCASGAFTAWALQSKAPHFRPTTDTLNQALFGYLQVRDSTPESSADVSHGNGFDRLTAVSDGITHGIAYCYRSDWTSRQFTERPFTTDSDYTSGGNESLDEVLNAGDPKSGGGGLQPNLNTFWKSAAQSIGKTFTDVKIAKADHPKCGGSDSAGEFGYCPDDNTVYYSAAFAKAAYYSQSELQVDRTTGDVSVVENQPGDYALGTLFVYGWGLAVRHQLFNRSLDDKDALIAAGCYAGAYSKSINVDATTSKGFVLSPPDMDEATSAVFTLVSQDKAFGARGTSNLDRIGSFNKGYFGGLSAC